MPLASLRSVVRAPRSAGAGQPPGEPVVRQAHRGRTRPALSGSCSASQRSLVTVNEATGTLPVALAPSSAGRRARRPGRRPRRPSGCRSTAAPAGRPRRRRRGRPCRAAGRRPRRAATSSSPPACADRGLQRVPPGGRVDLGAVRVRRPGPDADQRAGRRRRGRRPCTTGSTSRPRRRGHGPAQRAPSRCSSGELVERDEAEARARRRRRRRSPRTRTRSASRSA